VGIGWALGLAAPAVAAAALIFVVARLLDRGDMVQPPWYTAWLLLPGSFILAGAAAMCIFGALVEFPAITSTMWTLLVIGALTWATAMALVRSASH
jgi:drug/metabolite transporter (DMT)-like permease